MTDGDSSSDKKRESHLHLSEKYDRMVESQLSALSDVDKNAWRAARLIGILLGILLTGLSVVSQGENTGLSSSPEFLFFIAIGIVLLLCSLAFAAISILNVEVGYGPGTHISDGLTNGEVSPESYPAIVSKNLAKNIDKNNRVLTSKADKLRYTYNFLIVGLIALSTGIGFLIVSLDKIAILIISGLSLIMMVGISYYILCKKYDNEAKNDNESEYDDEAA